MDLNYHKKNYRSSTPWDASEVTILSATRVEIMHKTNLTCWNPFWISECHS